MKVQIRGLSKTYANGVKALDGISLTIPQGMYGLLGPNGSGKSTLMRILATLLDADAGEVTLGEIDVLKQRHEVRQRLGYLPQEFGVYPRISVWDMLDHLALLKGVNNRAERKELIGSLLQRVNLFDVRRKALAGFSGGMKQRFGVAQALIGNPELLIVDEPTAGLDPGERNRFYNMMSEISEKTVVILSTHIVQDVMELCSNMAIIHLGKVLYEGTPDKGVETLQGKVWKKFITKAEIKTYQEKYRVISTQLIGGRPLVHVFHPNDPDDGFVPVAPDLDDLFFSRIAGLN